jgi:soluble lytic murein transglycosylase-like protein
VATVAESIVSAAQAHGVDPRLALEVAIQESGLDQGAVGSHGEIGVFQLLPETAAGLGVDPNDPQQNISGGVRYLGEQLGRFGDPAAALAAYNWGPEHVAQAIAVHGAAWLDAAPGSTVNYVEDILGNLATRYSADFAPAGAVVQTVKAMDWKPVLWAVGVGIAVLIGVRLFERAGEIGH